MIRFYLHIVTYTLIGLAFASCATTRTDVITMCEMNNVNNYELRWDVQPPIDGKLKVYQFFDLEPSKFDLKNPIQEVNIANGHTEIVENQGQRAFFVLSFNDSYREITSNRFIRVPGIDYIMDLGGYRTNSGDQVAWGKILRSSQLSDIEPISAQMLKQMGVKTLITMQDERESINPMYYKIFPYVHSVPIKLNRYAQIYDRILRNECKRGDVMLYKQDLYNYLIDEKKNEYATIVKILAKPESYPVLVSSIYAKEKIDFLSVMLLAFLGVEEDMIIEDYLSINPYLNLAPHAQIVKKLDPDSQEAMTLLLTANRATAEYILARIRKEYGSVEKFFKKEWKMTDKDLSNLRSTLLYKY